MNSKTFFVQTKGILFSPLLVLAILVLVNSDQLSNQKILISSLLVPDDTRLESFGIQAQSQPYDKKNYFPYIVNEIPGYYVSTVGNDSNPGTQALPLRTIQHAADIAQPGDTITIRGGIYNEAIFTSNGGTPGRPIRYLAYPGEKPIIDGQGQLPRWKEALFTLYAGADYVVISGLEIKNSTFNGVLSWGSHVILDNLDIHDTQSTGILVMGDDSVIQYCRVYRSNLNNVGGVLPSNWGAGIEIVGTSNKITQNGLIRNCTAWDNWGEGINIHNTNNVTVEDNIVHDSLSTNIYISDATNALIQRNFVYLDRANDVYKSGQGAQVGIMMGDETYYPPTQNITIINNIAYGNQKNFYWWQGSHGGGLVNVLIANNTFVNSVDNFANTSTDNGGVKINNGNHQNSYFINNIIEQDGDGSLYIIEIYQAAGLQFSNNLWSKPPNSPIAASTTDIIGAPQLAGAPGFSFLPGSFKLTSSSPAIDKAKPLPQVAEDYFKNLRGAYPDTGANEYIPAP